MSADREMDHLEMMSGMIDRHHNQPAAFAETNDQVREEERRIELGNLREAYRLGLVQP